MFLLRILTNIDYKQLVKELDYECQYSSQTKAEIVRILCEIKTNRYGLYDNKKLQKLINQCYRTCYHVGSETLVLPLLFLIQMRLWSCSESYGAL